MRNCFFRNKPYLIAIIIYLFTSKKTKLPTNIMNDWREREKKKKKQKNKTKQKTKNGTQS